MARTSGRPYVISSCAMSLDGRIDDCSPERLILSNAADLDRVDEVRAGSDAILVGAGTVRRDDPRLAVRAGHRRAARAAAGRPATPIKVVLSGRGALDPSARLFTADPVEVIVYRAVGTPPPPLLAARATIVDLPARFGPSSPSSPSSPPGPSAPPEADAGPEPDAGLEGDAGFEGDAGPEIDVRAVVADLGRRGVDRLLVEGGTSLHTAFLTAGLVDELHLTVAPFFVGQKAAPTFVRAGRFPQGVRAPMHLAEVRQLGDVVFLRYLAVNPTLPRDRPTTPD